MQLPKYMRIQGREIAFKDETHISAISNTEPALLSVGGLWFQTI